MQQETIELGIGKREGACDRSRCGTASHDEARRKRKRPEHDPGLRNLRATNHVPDVVVKGVGKRRTAAKHDEDESADDAA